MTFEGYGLSENPFIGASEQFPLVDRREVLGHLAEVTSRFVEASSPAIIAVLGAYGLGKTAILHSVLSKIQKNEFLPGGVPPVRGAYMKALPPDSTSKYILYVYRSISHGLGLQTFLDWRAKAQADDRSPLGIPRALRAGGEDIAKAINSLGTPSRPGSGWTYLSGQKLPAASLSELSLSSQIDTNESAMGRIIDLLRLSKRMGEGGLVLLVDEWEYLFTATTRSKAVQLHTAVKEVYDRIREAVEGGDELAALTILIACTPLAWQSVIPRTEEAESPAGVQPFAQRVADEYTVEPLNLDYTRALIRSRLDARRIAQPKEPLSPFTEEAVKAIYGRAQGSPRDTLGCCAFLLEQAVLEDKHSIDGKFANELLQAYQFPLGNAPSA